MSAHFRDGPHGHGRAGDDDNEGADRREQADHAALELEAAEGPLREDRGEADPGDREREAGAEGDDQSETERDPVQRDGREEHDERGRAGEEPAGDADRGQGSPAELPVVVVMVMVVAVAVRPAVPGSSHEHGGPDPDHQQARDETDPGVELLGDDELRETERHESEREDADRVRHGHDQAEQSRVTRGTALAHEVGRDDQSMVINTSDPDDVEREDRGSVSSLTLIVSQEQALQLTVAKRNGDLDVALLPADGS